MNWILQVQQRRLVLASASRQLEMQVLEADMFDPPW